jgi:hypothetical protein
MIPVLKQSSPNQYGDSCLRICPYQNGDHYFDMGIQYSPFQNRDPDIKMAMMVLPITISIW